MAQAPSTVLSTPIPPTMGVGLRRVAQPWQRGTSEVSSPYFAVQIRFWYVVGRMRRDCICPIACPEIAPRGEAPERMAEPRTQESIMSPRRAWMQEVSKALKGRLQGICTHEERRREETQRLSIYKRINTFVVVYDLGYRGRVVRQRSAKPRTAVRFRSIPQPKQRKFCTSESGWAPPQGNRAHEGCD